MFHIRMVAITLMYLIAIGACAQEDSQQGGDSSNAQSDPGLAVHAAEAASVTTEERIERGRALYDQHCTACHQAEGQGLPGAFPPLADSDYLDQGAMVVVEAIINGLTGPITVNGVEYNAVMPALSYLSDSDVADVITFVMNTWDNPGGEVSAAEVAAVRGGEAISGPSDHPVSSDGELPTRAPQARSVPGR